MQTDPSTQKLNDLNLAFRTMARNLVYTRWLKSITLFDMSELPPSTPKFTGLRIEG